MKKAVTLKEVKSMLNMKYAQQIGGLDDERIFKEFKGFEVEVTTYKNKGRYGKWYYRYRVEIHSKTPLKNHIYEMPCLALYRDEISEPKRVVEIIDDFFKNQKGE